jgi:hypothetical protein
MQLNGRVVRVSDSTSEGSQTRQPPEPFDSEGLSGSGGGIREQPSAAKATATRSVAGNPRPPGYERGIGGRGFLNVLGMLWSSAKLAMEQDGARWNKSPAAVPTHNGVNRSMLEWSLTSGAAVEFPSVYPVRCAEREKNGCGIRDAGGYPEEERPWSNDDISTLIEDSRTW